MFLIIKNRFTCLLIPFITLLLLQGCANQNQASISLNRALDHELLNNQEQFLNKPISDVLIAFQRQPTSISILDKKNNVVWLYDIYDVLVDPQTGKGITLPGQLSFIENKVHWKEYYYANSDGIVYEIKIESDRF